MGTLKLRALKLNENKKDVLFQSAEGRQLLEMSAGFYRKAGFNFPWVSYLVLKDNQLVGTCSFVGKPVNGEVEIAYWTFQENEGRGIASSACRELIAIARQEDPRITITAKTAPEHNASTRILEKNGFAFKKVVQDDEIGDAWLWSLDQ